MKKKTTKAWAIIQISGGKQVMGFIAIPNEICGFTEPIFGDKKRALKYKNCMFPNDKRTKVVPVEIRITK